MAREAVHRSENAPLEILVDPTKCLNDHCLHVRNGCVDLMNALVPPFIPTNVTVILAYL